MFEKTSFRILLAVSIIGATIAFENCGQSGGSPLTIPGTGSATSTSNGLPPPPPNNNNNNNNNPPPAATCGISVSNNGNVYNQLAQGYNTGITISRSGTAVGNFSWTVACPQGVTNCPSGAGTDALLNNSASSDVFTYDSPVGSDPSVHPPVQAANYTITGQVTQSSDGSIIQCGTISVNVQVPPQSAGAPADASLPIPNVTGATAGGCSSATITGSNFPSTNYLVVAIRDTNWNIVAQTTVTNSASSSNVSISIPQSLQAMFQSPGLRFTVVNISEQTSWDTSPFITCSQ